jgi:hypothetical protein
LPDLLPNQASRETIQVNQISSITDLLMWQGGRDLLREPEGKIQPELPMQRDNPEDLTDWLV